MRPLALHLRIARLTARPRPRARVLGGRIFRPLKELAQPGEPACQCVCRIARPTALLRGPRRAHDLGHPVWIGVTAHTLYRLSTACGCSTRNPGRKADQRSGQVIEPYPSSHQLHRRPPGDPPAIPGARADRQRVPGRGSWITSATPGAGDVRHVNEARAVRSRRAHGLKTLTCYARTVGAASRAGWGQIRRPGPGSTRSGDGCYETWEQVELRTPAGRSRTSWMACEFHLDTMAAEILFFFPFRPSCRGGTPPVHEVLIARRCYGSSTCPSLVARPQTALSRSSGVLASASARSRPTGGAE